jgi:hypothetical protein
MSDDDFDGDDFAEEGFDGDDSEPVPLTREEAAQVRRDLDDLANFRHAFEPEGFKGVSVFCPDCADEHFYGWDMIQGNLQALLADGETPVHEPAFDPHPEDYIGWQYAQGYLDGFTEDGGPPAPPHTATDGGCPFCGATLPDDHDSAVFCPACGIHLGPARIANQLLDQGWSSSDVADLLRAAQLPPLRGLSSD